MSSRGRIGILYRRILRCTFLGTYMTALLLTLKSSSGYPIKTQENIEQGQFQEGDVFLCLWTSNAEVVAESELSFY